jgi:pyruvate kinase
MANELKAAGMLVFTMHGTMAKYAAWMRPHYSPIFAVCPDARVAESLSLHRAVYPVVVPFTHRESEPLIGEALKQLIRANRLKPGDQIVIISSIAIGDSHADAIQMRTIE